MTRFVFYYRTTLELLRREEGECILGEAGWRGYWTRKHGSWVQQELNVQDFTNEEITAKPLLLMLCLQLTFDHNNVCLRADPLDFWRLLQFIAVRVVGSTALIHARFIEGEASEVNGASGMSYICGIYMHMVVPCAVKELGEGLVGLFTLYKPPLHLRDGVSYHLTMQLCAVTDELRLRQRRLDKPRWAPFTVSPANRDITKFWMVGLKQARWFHGW